MGAPGGVAGLEILCDGFNARPGSPVTPRAAWTAVGAEAKGGARTAVVVARTAVGGHMAALDWARDGGWTCPAVGGHVRRRGGRKELGLGDSSAKNGGGGPIYRFWELGESK